VTRPIVLVLVRHYLPGYKSGGPVRSIVNLVNSLSDQFEFRILCADRDLGDTEPYKMVVPGQWTPAGRASVHYTPPASQTLWSLARIIRETPHDLLYLNSFFSPRFTIFPLAARRLGLIPSRPLIIAPRGEFSPAALGLKRTRKRAYMALAYVAKLVTDAVWQASSEHEVADIRSALSVPARSVRVAMDLPSPLPSIPPRHRARSRGDPLRVVFLSRISPKKNLDYALEVLLQVKVPVSFSIYGPSEDDVFQAKCEKLAAQLPPHIAVSWRGVVDPANVPKIMADHDLFFLPTRGENFGHVIAEALGAATPVLLSDTTPWRRLAELGVGHDLPLDDPSAFAAVIERMAMASRQEAEDQRARAFAYAFQRQRDEADIEANRRLFAAAMEKR
jgi:glycosyltransferase involved in cell wall biosynthesis